MANCFLSHNLVRYRIEFGGLPSFTPRARAGAQPARSVMHREAQPKGPARGGALFIRSGGGFNSLIVSGPNLRFMVLY